MKLERVDWMNTDNAFIGNAPAGFDWG